MKRIRALHQKKYRLRDGLYLAEGRKTVAELLSSGSEPVDLWVTEGEVEGWEPWTPEVVDPTSMARASALSAPSGVLATFPIPEPKPLDSSGWVVVLDRVRDPGNLGTIVRSCDWFGFRELFCTHGTVDPYNPKALQASMGSVARVNICYGQPGEWPWTPEAKVFGTFMEGEDLYSSDWPERGFLVMGNEAQGIHPTIEARVDGRIAIPRAVESRTESLNVATATALVLAEFSRRAR